MRRRRRRSSKRRGREGVVGCHRSQDGCLPRHRRGRECPESDPQGSFQTWLACPFSKRLAQNKIHVQHQSKASTSSLQTKQASNKNRNKNKNKNKARKRSQALVCCCGITHTCTQHSLSHTFQLTHDCRSTCSSEIQPQSRSLTRTHTHTHSLALTLTLTLTHSLEQSSPVVVRAQGRMNDVKGGEGKKGLMNTV